MTSGQLDQRSGGSLAKPPSRGSRLLRQGERFANPPGLFARVFAPGIQKLLDAIDQGIARGSIEVDLPDGSRRMLGGRAQGYDAKVTIRDWRALLRLATRGSIGWYQGWEAGEWESDDLVPIFANFADNAQSLGDIGRSKGVFRWLAALAHRVNRNDRKGAERNIHLHYDLGNDFYREWLDETMTYSSALFGGEERSLEDAQRAKWGALAKRIGPAKEVLEIGCGWGGLANHLGARGASVTAISLSDEQLEWARSHYDNPKIAFQKSDYRDVTGQYDAIVSVEMVEALGREYWPTFMDCIARNLKPGGKAAIQFIAMDENIFEGYARNPDFIQAYVFPGGLLIRASEFRALAEARGLRWSDQRGFGRDYARTLARWRANFDRAVDETRLPRGFDEQFIGLWRFYLDYCQGGFAAGMIDVHQVTLTKEQS